MLRSLIMASNIGDGLDARSLALSALLGTHPPVLPGKALVALAELFGIAGGTMRTALSRAVARGEIDADAGRYRLTGRLLDRQRAQDTGRRAPDRPWHGAWHVVVTIDDRRTLAERRRFRSLMADHRVAELRPDIWMRPANLDPPSLEPPNVAGLCVVTTGPIGSADPAALVGRLWDLDAIARSARTLDTRLVDVVGASASTGDDDPTPIPGLFVLAAEVVRFLRSEPLLPAALLPPTWPVDQLRARYDAAEVALQRRLATFFSSAISAPL
jgi:phenylacetic acid degradation operon negative regulatory protein